MNQLNWLNLIPIIIIIISIGYIFLSDNSQEEDFVELVIMASLEFIFGLFNIAFGDQRIDENE